MKVEDVTSLKRHATALLAELRSTGEPILITVHGKPSAYLVGVAAYDAQKRRMALLEGIAKGELAVLEQRVRTHAEAREHLGRWLD